MKILTEIFCQKLIVSNVFSAFLYYLKPKFFFRRPTMVAGKERPPFSKYLHPPLVTRCLLVGYSLQSNISKHEYWVQKLYPTGSSPGIFYSTAMPHKISINDGVGELHIHRIFSNIRTSTSYQLAKHLAYTSLILSGA